MLIVRWFAEQLSKRGLLPKKLAMMVGMAAPTKSKGDCCSKDVAATTNGKNSAKTGVVTTIETVEQFDSILQSQSQSNGYTVVKFTATWCKPCKAIQPFVDELAVLHSGAASFVSVDVDDLDDISGRYNVMAMPTFIAFHGGEKVDSMSGTKESKLEEFVKKNLPTVSLNKAKNM